MISVEEAKSRLDVFRPRLKTETRDVKNAVGFVLAETVVSPIDMPPFPQSAMDGYALGKGERSANSKFNLIGEIAAGSSKTVELNEGECVRIFTGSAVPKSAVAVVQQEWVTRDDKTITLTQEVASGKNIRPQGEQIKTGSEALKAKSFIKPATIGFLNMLGIESVSVYRKPKVAILVTGNELVAAGEPLQYGQVYEANAQMLQTALQQEGLSSEIKHVRDNLNDTESMIQSAVNEFDMVVISGGISVGDHDHVGAAFKNLGVKEIFYKVAQKPGKPLYFGTIEDKAVFGLPGNPAASLTCFYEYVLPLVRRSFGRTDERVAQHKLPFVSGKVQSINRAQFLKAVVSEGVQILDGQSSAMLNTFAQANALVYVRPNANQPKVGELLEVHLLPL